MNYKINRQKLVADDILSRLELLDPRCIVAGGAPRDWHLGKAAKDIDVFLYAPQLNSAYIREDVLKRLGFSINSFYENWGTDEIYKHNKGVQCLYNTVVDGEDVQIIFMTESTYTSVLDKFPVSISKVWYKNKQIKLSEDAIHSFNYKILWRTLDSYSEDDKYINRIKDKFAGYSYVTKPEAMKIIAEGKNVQLIRELRQQLYECETQSKKQIYALETKITELKSKYREALIELGSIKKKYIPEDF